ncbi:MAG: hypothetical protein IKW81_14135 [Pseudobutyrivibrio sp.]|nr:hypothetical protein [Pseudobutyrivibrio sp.]
MGYVIQSTERLKKTGADFETKAMLYLMCFRADSEDIDFFVVDFFNDITGTDRFGRKLWDVQSKASGTATAKGIGRELVTLFKNYISDIDFYTYVLFLGGVPDTFRKNSSKSIFGIDNVKDKAKTSIVNGLIEEGKAKEYINDTLITDMTIKSFLKKLVFVIDDKQREDYIREIIKNHPKLIPANDKLLAIFNEIRNKQSEKKNINVEGTVIFSASEALEYGKHLSAIEIKMLVIQRIINCDPVSGGIPVRFADIYHRCTPESRNDMLDQCRLSVCSAMFNKSAQQYFWRLFENIYTTICESETDDVNVIYEKLDKNIVEKCPDFDVLSLKYFIAKIMEGVL